MQLTKEKAYYEKMYSNGDSINGDSINGEFIGYFVFCHGTPVKGYATEEEAKKAVEMVTREESVELKGCMHNFYVDYIYRAQLKDIPELKAAVHQFRIMDYVRAFYNADGEIVEGGIDIGTMEMFSVRTPEEAGAFIDMITKEFRQAAEEAENEDLSGYSNS